MLRLLGFFVGAILLMNVLRAVPGVGGLFHGFLGFWLSVALVAVLASQGSEWLIARRRLANSIRALGHVDSPHNRGKLGSLYAGHRRFAQALPHLEAACAGEPDFAEWHFRRGQALAALGKPGDALESFERAAAIDEDHAYGAVQLAQAKVHAALGLHELALEDLDHFERGHGPSPESAYRRGRALRALGRRGEAADAFRDVSKLAATAARFQRKHHREWVFRAWLARLA
jgi:tetratricopeptide (TPR) repeat protein